MLEKRCIIKQKIKGVIIMLVNRKTLDDYLYKEISRISSNTKKKKKILTELEDEYGMPISVSSDIITLRKELDYYNEYELFLVLSKLDKNKLSDFYTEKEIKAYSSQHYEIEKLKFPIKFKVIPVADDQWIGATNFKYLMELRNAQLINYNENTQRTLIYKIKNGVEKFFISLNFAAVKAIKESIINKRYIPDTITLNLQEDDEKLDYTYNVKTSELIIKNATALDIIDGYHRYIAFGQAYDLDNEVDYPVEIRITNFSESKANQFIYQEDQKTKMTRTDSNSFNQYDSGNQIATRLDSDPQFNLNGEIKKNGGKINYAILATAVNLIYFNNKNVDKKEIITTSKRIKEGINRFTEEYEEYIDRKWTTKEILIILYCINNDYAPSDIIEKINRMKNVDFNLNKNAGKYNRNIIKILQEEV